MPLLIFDLGDVIIRGFKGTERALTHDLELPEDTIRRQLHEPELQELFLGQMSEEQYWRTLIERHRWNTTIENLQQRVRDNMTEVEGMFPLVEELQRRGTQLSLFSNQTSTWADHIEQRYPQIIEFFPVRWYSHHIRLAKPDPLAYHHVIKESGRRPQEILFIDDYQLNLLGASKVGLRTLQFHTPHQLRQALQMQGYL